MQMDAGTGETEGLKKLDLPFNEEWAQAGVLLAPVPSILVIEQSLHIQVHYLVQPIPGYVMHTPDRLQALS
jgi:hypothetical protein